MAPDFIARTDMGMSPWPLINMIGRWLDSISARSAMLPSAVSVDDPCAIEVVRRELAANAITRQDADTEAAHLACDVSEDDMVVVELYTEHCVRQSLDHLALEFNLVLLRH